MAILQILGLFIAPLYLFILGIIPLWYRFIVLGTVVIAISLIIIHERWTLRDAGLKIDIKSGEIIPYGLFTVIALIALYFYAIFLGGGLGHPPFGYPLSITLAVVLSFAQEFMFRSFLIPKLSILFSSKVLVAFIDALIFASLHILYPDFAALFPVAFIGGLGFATLYTKFPNLLLVTAAHTILNFATAMLGLFFLAS